MQRHVAQTDASMGSNPISGTWTGKTEKPIGHTIASTI